VQTFRSAHGRPEGLHAFRTARRQGHVL